jgi:hypothetical protein
LKHARHGDAHHTISVPQNWSVGRITFSTKTHTGTPASWAERNTIRGAIRYDIKGLKNAGGTLPGTYYKERYSSEELCGIGAVVIRETALVYNPHLEAGTALHVDVCEADLYLESEPGVTNEVISSEIILSLREHG